MKPEQNHPVTDEEFALFKRKVYEFIDSAGVHEWKVYCCRTKSREQNSGWVGTNFTQKKAFIHIAETLYLLREDTWEAEIIYCAAHEVAELMLWQMNWMSQKYYNSDIVDEYRHEVINHIVRLFLEKEE